jgi:hypothetical protein
MREMIPVGLDDVIDEEAHVAAVENSIARALQDFSQHPSTTMPDVARAQAQCIVQRLIAKFWSMGWLKEPVQARVEGRHGNWGVTYWKMR